MTDQETYLVNAFETTLAAEMSAVASSFTLDDATGLTEPFYVVIEPDDVSQREYIFVSSLSGAVCTVGSRYLAGSAAPSGLVHPVGSVVRMSVMAQHLEDINDRVDAAEASITGIGDHGGLSGLGDDDHSQYLNTTRHDADDHSAVDHGGIQGLDDDDHTQYHNAARHAAADHSAIDANDPDAIHDDVAGEIAALTLKGSPHVNDILIIEDSESGNAKKRATVSSVVSAGSSTDHGVLSGLGDDDHPQYLKRSGGTMASNLDPASDNAYDLGDAARSWRRLYAFDIYNESGSRVIDLGARLLDAGTWQVDGSFHPQDDVAHDLGSATQTWRRLYANDVYNAAGTNVMDLANQQMLGTWKYGTLIPLANEAYDLGSASLRFDTLYAGWINTASNSVSKIYRETTGGGNGILTFSSNVGGTDVQKAYVNASGDFYSATGNYLTISDERLKRNIRDAEKGHLAQVRQLRLRRFDLPLHLLAANLGFIAQEVETVIPEAVHTAESGDKALSELRLVRTLVGAVQELADMVEAR